MEKKFKITLCILVIALISVVAFLGVYKKELVSYKNILPEYVLSSELTGKRVTYFKVSDATEEKIYDKDGNEVDAIPEGADETEYKKETVKINADEALTEENFRTVKKIFDGRLKGIGVEDFNVRLDTITGDVVVELADNESTDSYLQNLLYKGDVTLTNTESENKLFNRNDIKDVALSYRNLKSGNIEVYLIVKLNDEASKKMESLSETYLKAENEEEQKTITLNVESSKIAEISFDKVVENGEFEVSLIKSDNNQTLNSYLNYGSFICYLINNGEMPIKYTITTSEFIASELSGNVLYVIIGVLSIVTLLIIAYMIFKYKSNGVFAGLSIISAVAILLLFVKYTKITISLGSFAAMAILITIEVYFILKILNAIKKDAGIDNTKYVTTKIYLKRLDVIIVLLITAIVFTFMKEVKVYSIGMTLFYGMISLAIANFAFLRTLLIENHK